MIKLARRPALFALLLTQFVFFSFFVPSDAVAQTDENFDFYARGAYRQNVPRPQSILRYDVGEFHTNYAMMERVVTQIATAAPDRVREFQIGETNERRMMRLLAISAPENIGRLDQIRANINRLSDPRGLSAEEARRIASETPVIVWLNYNIHGDESASFETMMQVVYQLAASEEAATSEILKNTIALINCSANPDGHERFVTWYNANGIGDASPAAQEHSEPWSVWGRGNRYRFDLNRDNIASTQLETRNVQRAFMEWHPQVFVDHHGETTQYFFPPAAQPINPNILPAQNGKWLTTFGRANAQAFDSRGWDYYVRNIFDLFYPGYWDSFPALNGASGMTYETDGGGAKGYRWRRDDETIVTLRSGIAKHFVGSMTTLETAARNRAARLADYYEFKRSAIEEGRTGLVKRFVILPGSDPQRAAELVEVLLRAGIEVGRATDAFRSTRAHGYTEANQSARDRSFPAGAYVVDLAQPQKRLAMALLEQNTEQDPEFVREQNARYARNQRRGASASKEEYGFYDVTAWSLPLAFGVEAYWTEDAGVVNQTALRATNTNDFVISGNTNGGTSGENLSNQTSEGARTRETEMFAPTLRSNAARRNALVASTLAPAGGVTGRASVAYIVPYEQNNAASLIARLLQEDFKLAVATKQLNAGGRDWARGTVVVRVSRNAENLHERIAQLAREAGVTVTAINSGFAESGETGIGSEAVVSLKRPRIILIADDAVLQTSYGAIWHLFERYGVEFTPMTVRGLRNAKLDDYNVIIMPDGSPGAYFSQLGKPGVELLRGWTERGGTLVCIKGAAVFAALKDVNLTSSRLVGSDDDDQKEDAKEGQPQASQITGSNSNNSDVATQTSEAQTSRDKRSRRRSNQSAQNQSAQNNQNTQSAPQPTTREAGAGGGEETTEKMEGAPPDLPPIASPSAKPNRVPQPVPGAIMRATLDRTTPLTFGYNEQTMPVLVDSAYFFRPSKEGTNAIVFDSASARPLRIAGFIWQGNTERLLRGTSYLIEESTGRGHVVLYAEDPNFRGFWKATTRLFFNSLLFQTAF